MRKRKKIRMLYICLGVAFLFFFKLNIYASSIDEKKHGMGQGESQYPYESIEETELLSIVDVIDFREFARLPYTGKEQIYVPTLLDHGDRLEVNQDFTIDFHATSFVGNAKKEVRIPYTITGIGKYYGTVESYYSIMPDAVILDDMNLTIQNTEIEYDGTEISLEKLGVTLTKKKFLFTQMVALDQQLDVRIICERVPGKGYVIITPSRDYMNPYAGMIRASFDVKAAYDIQKDTIWNGDSWEEKVSYSKCAAEGDGIIPRTNHLLVDRNGSYLEEGVDYTVVCKNNHAAGIATMIIHGMNAYSGSISRTYQIEAKSELYAQYDRMVPYTLSGGFPKLQVYDQNGTLLEIEKDYIVKCSGAKNVGTARFTVVGQGNYIDSKEIKGSYQVSNGEMNTCKVKVEDVMFSTEENGYYSLPEVYDAFGNQLCAGVDYDPDLTYEYDGMDAGSIPDVGTEVNVIIEGAGNYAGSYTQASYYVLGTDKRVSDLFVSFDPIEYENVPVTFSWDDQNMPMHIYATENDMRNGEHELDAPKIVKVLSYENNNAVGMAKIELAGIGSYSGIQQFTFEISKKKYPKVYYKDLSEVNQEKSLSVGDKLVLSNCENPENQQYEEGSMSSGYMITSMNENIAKVQLEEGQVEIVGISEGPCLIQVEETDTKRTILCRVNVVDQKKEENKIINVIDYGVVPDDGKNDEVILNQLIENAEEGTVIYLPDGVYDINTDMNVSPDGINFYHQKGIKLQLADGAVLKAIPNGNKNYEVVRFLYSNQCSIEGGTILGERDNHMGTEGEWGHGIGIYESKNITVKNMDISKCFGDGVYVGDFEIATSNTNIKILDCNIHDNRRNNISITSGLYVTISNCELINANGTDPQFGIDIETNYQEKPCEHIYLFNTNMTDNANGSFGIITNADDVVLWNCNLDGYFFNFAGKNVRCKGTNVLGEIRDTVGTEWIP